MFCLKLPVLVKLVIEVSFEKLIFICGRFYETDKEIYHLFVLRL